MSKSKLFSLDAYRASLEALKAYFENYITNSSHDHSNKTILDKITAPFTTALSSKLDSIEEGANKTIVDDSLSTTSTNPVQNKVITDELYKKVPETRTINGKALTDNITLTAKDVGADASGSATNALTSAKQYTDTQVASTKQYVDTEVANLVDSAPETLDTLGKLANALKDNSDITDVINQAISDKADKSDLQAHTQDTNVHVTSTEKQQITTNATQIEKIVDGETSVGHATTADKLKSAKTFSISGGATASGVSFDGSDNVALQVTSLNAMQLTIANTDTLILNGDCI